MALKTVKYTTTNCIDCAFTFPAEVILCVTASKVAPHLCQDDVTEQTWDYRHIVATLTDVSKPCNSSYYTYTFSYDDALLNTGEVLFSTDILGIFCKGCESTYFEDLIGDEISFTSEEDGSITIHTQHGCEFNFFPGESSLSVLDTNSVNLTLTAGVNKILSADVKISAQAGNEISILADGLFADFSQSFTPPADGTTDLGSAALRFRNLYLSDSIRFANNVYAQWRNAANSAWLDVLKLDALDDVILNATTGNEIRFAINFLECWGITSSGQLEQHVTNGGDLIFNQTDGIIRQATTDGSDTKSVSLFGGATVSASRGARVQVFGNEYVGSGGDVVINAGSAVGASIFIGIAEATGLIQFQNAAGAPIWVLNNAGDFVQDTTSGGGIILAKTGAALESILQGIGAVDADISSVTGPNPSLLISQNSNVAGDHFALVNYGANASGAKIRGFKTREASGNAANTIVQSSDVVLQIEGYGADGAAYIPAARITFEIDGTPGLNDMPGRINFATVSDGGATNLSRWIINSSGHLAQDGTNGAEIVFKRPIGYIRQDTADTADNQSVQISGGGGSTVSHGRAAYLQLFGNEAAETGDAILSAGNNGGEVIFRTNNSQNRWVVDASGNFAQDGTDGGDIVFNLTNGIIRQGTSDTTDNKAMLLCGGGAANGDRGAICHVYGNEYVGEIGNAYLDSGKALGAVTRIRAQAADGLIIFTTGGTTEKWRIAADGDLEGAPADGGDVVFNRIGKGIKILEGANGRMGQATLIGGTLTVANTSITANTRIFLSVDTIGGTPGFLDYTLIAATSFTINSTSVLDTSTVNWLLIEPA